jgi:hypothetical protein
MRRLLFFLLTVVVIASAACFRREEREDFRIADNIVAQNDKRIRSQGFDLYLTGGSYRNTIRRVAQGYISKTLQFSSVDQARPFIVKQIQTFVEPFNEEKRIRMYLQNFPFTAKNIELYFCFEDAEKIPKPRLPPLLAKVSCIEGEIRYSIWNEKTDNLQTVHSESYEEACNICAKTKNKTG